MRFKKSLTFFALLQIYLFSATFDVNTTLELRQALENVAINGENDTIILQPGIYSTDSDGLGTFMFNDTEEYNLTIEGADGYSMNDIVLDGNSTHQVINFTNNKSFTLKIKNLSINNGKSESRGGGLYTTSNIIVEDCNISNNSAENSGGGFYANGNATVTNSTISNNSMNGHTANSGGGFYANGFVVITNSIILNNYADGLSGNDGGGFYAKKFIVITNSNILNNYAYNNGGGFYANSNATVIHSIISNNSAKYGSGFYANDTTVANSTISNNSANNQYGIGGGFYANDTTVANSTISNNSSKLGGGFYARNTTITNSTISNNSANNSGGFYAIGYSMAINNNFINNSNKIKTYGVFINNIFINDGVDFTGDSKLYHNYIDYGKLAENNHIVIKKSNLLPTVAGDINLADNNITLQSNSPAINAGLNPTDDLFKNALSEDNYTKVLNYLKTDYFGNERVANSKIDIGASEYGATAFNENKPKISINISGNQKVYSAITVNIDINTSNTISELYVDKGNGYKSTTTTQRSFTISYNSSGEYTLKVKVVDNQGNIAEIAKSITIYDLSTQEAIEYGKKLCQENPASCGISENPTTTQDILENQKLTDSTSGWRLLGSNMDLTPSEIFSKNPKVSIVWAYKDGEWQAKGVNNTIDTVINNNNISAISTIENGDGFWIYVK